jgi:hypothetical protein
MSIETILGSLTTSEKLDATDFLWRDTSRESAAFDSPSWHEDFPNARIANPLSKPSLELEDVIKGVRERLNARKTT